MKFEGYRKKLLTKERELIADLERTGISGREKSKLGALDSGDESALSHFRENLFAQADHLSQLLKGVRGALKRIEDGTYGRCLDDGAMIDSARLQAVPWTLYCLKHQSVRDRSAEEPLLPHLRFEI